MIDGTPKCRWPRFGTVFLLTLVACLAGFFASMKYGYEAGKAQRASEVITVRIYEVQDLMEVGPISEQANCANLVELLIHDVAPQTWDNAGGPGRVNVFHNSPIRLVITQTAGVHDQIDAILHHLRQNLKVSSHDRL